MPESLKKSFPLDEVWYTWVSNYFKTFFQIYEVPSLKLQTEILLIILILFSQHYGIFFQSINRSILTTQEYLAVSYPW